MRNVIANLSDKLSAATPLRTFFASWILLSVIAVLWSLATPLAAVPDEPAHVMKAAFVVRGEFIGRLSSFGSYVDLPRYVHWTNLQACYARQPDVSADCIKDVPGNPWTTVLTTTTAGLYNPVYYVLVG